MSATTLYVVRLLFKRVSSRRFRDAVSVRFRPRFENKTVHRHGRQGVNFFILTFYLNLIFFAETSTSNRFRSLAVAKRVKVTERPPGRNPGERPLFATASSDKTIIHNKHRVLFAAVIVHRNVRIFRRKTQVKEELFTVVSKKSPERFVRLRFITLFADRIQFRSIPLFMLFQINGRNPNKSYDRTDIAKVNNNKIV